MQIHLNRRCVGGYMEENANGTVTAYDAFADARVTMPRGKAVRLLSEFDRSWPVSDYLHSIRHLIEEELSNG